MANKTTLHILTWEMYPPFVAYINKRSRLSLAFKDIVIRISDRYFAEDYTVSDQQVILCKIIP